MLSGLLHNSSNKKQVKYTLGIYESKVMSRCYG